MQMKILLTTILLLLFMGICQAKGIDEKPRVIVMTDGEIDDQTSMIRFLLYTCDIDLEAIIETNSIFQRKGHSNEDWYEKQLNAYEEIYPNLIKHNPDYPTPKRLRDISFVGDEDESHINDLWWKNLFSKMIPGADVIYTPKQWEDTPGSDRIIEVLLDDKSGPVFIQAWGGANTAARAFYKLKMQYPKDYEKAISKVIMYNIWYQDGAGTYIEHDHPKVTMLYSTSFKGSWDYDSQINTHDFVEKNVKKNHGPLGALYPQDYISEGDSPSFFYNLASGLKNDVFPTFGGWGGRFVKFKNTTNTFIDAIENGDKWLSLRRWINDVNLDFQARMDWCVKPYNEANHHPIVSSKIPDLIIAKPGEKVILNSKKTTDPDKNEISYTWWHYHFAGDKPYQKEIEINHKNRKKATIKIPEDATGKDIHIILTIEDNGTPSLKSYHRLIISVQE